MLVPTPPHPTPQPKIYMLNFNPQGDVLGGGVFGRWLGHMDRALMNGLDPLQKWPQSTPLPFCHVRAQQEDGICEPGSGSSPESDQASTLISDFPASRTVRNKILLFVNHPVYDILLQQPEQIKIIYGFKAENKIVHQ